MARFSKRADVEIQFNWIFVLIAGGIILLVFFAVSNSLKKGSEENVQLDVSGDLRTTLIGVKVGKSSTDIPVPSVGINLDCDGLKVGSLQGIRMGPIFGPREIRGNKVQAWSQDWSAPMRLDNFMFLTTAQVKYLFVKENPDQGLMLDLVDTLPSLNMEVVDDCAGLAAAVPSDNLDVKIVMFDTNPGTPSVPYGSPCESNLAAFNGRVRETSITVIRPDTTLTLEDALNSGYVYMADISDLQYKKTLYIGDALAYAAIYAGDAQIFSCMYSQALGNGALVFKAYGERAKYLRDKAGARDSCEASYGTVSSSTGDLTKLFTSFDELSKGVNINTNAATIKSSIPNLKGLNEQLQVQSCPSLY